MQTNRHAPLAHVLDLLLDVVCVVDPQGRFLYVSAACERVFGYTPEEMIGRPMIDLVWPEDRARTLAAVDEIVAGDPKPNFENRYRRKDGRVVHVMWSARWSEADQVRVAVARDVTERKRAESMQSALYAVSEAAHAAEDLLALFRRVHQIVGELLPAANFYVALYDAAADRLSFPYHVDEVDAAPPPGPLDAGTSSAAVIRSGQALHIRRGSDPPPEPIQPDVGTGPLDWLGVPLSAHNGIIGALVVKSRSDQPRYSARDVELLKFVSAQVAAAIERKQAETRLKHLAGHDTLTDLPNRTLFGDRLATALARARRERALLAMLYLDLDSFKPLNDSLGHAAGDRLLQEVAHRLRQCVRQCDTVARMGGDEFVVLLSIHAPGDAALVADKIRLALCRPFDLDGRPVAISASIGIACHPEHGDDGERLIRRADEAMYEAKRRGGNRSEIAAP